MSNLTETTTPNNNTTNTPTSTKTKKRLSGATMGMRFMQRRQNNSTKVNPDTNTTGGSSRPIGSNHDDSNITIHTGDQSHSQQHHNDNHEENNYKWEIKTHKKSLDKTDNDISMTELNDDDNDDYNNNTIPLHFIFEKTSPSEHNSSSSIHSHCYDIIGRRSFNKFNKAVEETYQAALHARRQSKIDKRVEKQHISDEELMKRYEKYVNGRRGEEHHHHNIGNLKEKLGKKKRKRNEKNGYAME